MNSYQPEDKETLREPSKAPEIQPVYTWNTNVNGFGIPGSTIVVRFPNGQEASTHVDEKDLWGVPVTGVLAQGDTITIYQIEEGKRLSQLTTTIVRAD